MNLLADDFERRHRIDLREDPSALQRLREAAALAKVELSSSLTTEVNLPFVGMIGKKPLH